MDNVPKEAYRDVPEDDTPDDDYVETSTKPHCTSENPQSKSPPSTNDTFKKKLTQNNKKTICLFVVVVISIAINFLIVASLVASGAFLYFHVNKDIMRLNASFESQIDRFWNLQVLLGKGNEQVS